MIEAERQLLIALIEMEEPVETDNNRSYRFYPQTLDEAGTYFGVLREDWNGAYSSLVEQKLISPNGERYSLTEAGKKLARQQRQDHPPIYYWYRQFYPLAASSPAYARFCQKLYGANLYQAGFSDVEQIDSLLKIGNLKPRDRILDLGCGLGGVLEYLSDCSGAFGLGLDYAPEAVDFALWRTRNKRERLNFIQGNLDHLDSLPKKFDIMLSIDTLYMPNQLPETLRKMQALAAPGGQMLVFYSHFAFQPGEPRERLTPGGNALGQALAEVGLSYQTWDFSEATFYLMRRKHRLALEMTADFETEGSQVLLEFLLSESDAGDEPFDARTNPYSRYLYRIAC
jgi:SAM-dependent methyltransferase